MSSGSQQTPTTNLELTTTVPANSSGRLMLGEYPSEELVRRFTFRISPPSDDGVVVHETFDKVPGGVRKIVFIENFEGTDVTITAIPVSE
ncbi:hypothetical protein [Streptomyces sp. NPDC050548]|uniref:hypothetical protein n=1 Tax=Streptomyces sp. NPDC050548 TaxID=3365629 RepID=UPI0037BB0E48